MKKRGFENIVYENKENGETTFNFSISSEEKTVERRMLSQAETLEEVKQYVYYIKNQLNKEKVAKLILPFSFFERKDNFIHWWLFGKALKELFSYVTMQRLNKVSPVNKILSSSKCHNI